MFLCTWFLPRVVLLLKHRTLHYGPRTLHYGPIGSGKIIYACGILHNIALYGNIAQTEIQLVNEEIPIDGVREDDWHHEGREAR
ncbi:hypothetical protein QE152_g25998 [Popillia japonica]|uniref:Uncharacterized protein n=1 Tax=Popillia japonica TaxID=7064 RepID=A0AAW1JYN9_POPJA